MINGSFGEQRTGAQACPLARVIPITCEMTALAAGSRRPLPGRGQAGRLRSSPAARLRSSPAARLRGRLFDDLIDLFLQALALDEEAEE